MLYVYMFSFGGDFLSFPTVYFTKLVNLIRIKSNLNEICKKQSHTDIFYQSIIDDLNVTNNLSKIRENLFGENKLN